MRGEERNNEFLRSCAPSPPFLCACLYPASCINLFLLNRKVICHHAFGVPPDSASPKYNGKANKNNKNETNTSSCFFSVRFPHSTESCKATSI